MLTSIFDFLFHRHHWGLLSKDEIIDKTEDAEDATRGFLYVSRCTKCGKIKTDKVYV